MSAVDQRGVRGEQLNWRDLDQFAFADGFASLAIGLLRDVIAFADTDASVAPGFARPHQTGNFIARRDAGRLSEAKLARGRDQFLPAQPLAQRREIVVARIGNCLRR